MWLRVLGVKDTLSESHVYLRGYDVDNPGKSRVLYVRLSGLKVRPDAHHQECNNTDARPGRVR